MANDDTSVSNPPVTSALRRVKRKPREVAPTPTALAFAITGEHMSAAHRVTVVRWTEAAQGHLDAMAAALRQEKPKRGLPTVALRGRLELADHLSLRLDRSVGMAKHRTVLWTQTDPATARAAINNAVLMWLVNDFTTVASNAVVAQQHAHLKALVRANNAIHVTHRVTNPYQWAISASKTVKSLAESSYADLADYVAHQLEGKAVFPQLGALRRITNGRLDSNQAELMTEPVCLHAGFRFSLVVRVRVFSYPGQSLPVIAVEFARRVWATGLKNTSTARTISGYALPKGSTRAFRFTLQRKKGDDGKYHYVPHSDFSAIARHYLSGDTFTTERIIKEGVQFDACQLLVVLKHGVATRSKVKSGVPDLDKLEGFEGIARELMPLGLQPWHGFQKLASATTAATDRNQQWTRRMSDDEVDQERYAYWLQEAHASIQACYEGDHHIVIAVQPGCDADADEAAARLASILVGSVTTYRIPCSSLVHGPRSRLPGNDLSAAARAAQRIDEWSTFIESVQRYQARVGRQIDGILVIARQWYDETQHDDVINKRAARIALARGLAVPVQYLRPRSEVQDKEEQNFEQRLMAAWLDLAYKSLGRIRTEKLRMQADAIYTSSEVATLYPDRVLALGVVRRNTNRFIGNERSVLPYAIELDVARGVCTASFAYEHRETHNLVVSEPLLLPQALVALARLGPIQLTTAKENRLQHMQERAQAFFEERMADVGTRSTRPLMIVDANTTRSVWPWLRDETLDGQNVHLAGGYHTQDEWPVDARFVRIRFDNSPKILWDGVFVGEMQKTGERITYRAPKWSEAELFKLQDVATHVYMSFGSNIRTGRVLGRSGYRIIPGARQVGRRGPYAVDDMEPYSKAWTTPVGVEWVVVRTGNDDPDRVAQFVELLRQCYAHFGEWTSKPAPLFFERVFKEYLADYELEDDEEDGVDEGVDNTDEE